MYTFTFRVVNFLFRVSFDFDSSVEANLLRAHMHIRQQFSSFLQVYMHFSFPTIADEFRSLLLLHLTKSYFMFALLVN